MTGINRADTANVLLADEGIYLASESSLCRVLREANAQHHRSRSSQAPHRSEPPRHFARKPPEVSSWGIT